MNMLNSIILEGDICKLNELSEAEKTLEFNIQVARTYRDASGKLVTEAPSFIITANGNLAVCAASKAREGRGVRVVGRLIESDGKVKVFAEHIEFKPEKPKKKEA